MKTETHFVDIESYIYRTKIDLFKRSNQMAGFKVTCWERVVECHLDDDNKPTFSVGKFEDDGKTSVLRKGFGNLGKQWSKEDM